MAKRQEYQVRYILLRNNQVKRKTYALNYIQWRIDEISKIAKESQDEK